MANPKLPASFVITVTADGKAAWKTDAFSESHYTRSDRWKLYVNGVVVQQGFVTQTEAIVCPTASTGSCVPGIRQSGSLVIPMRKTDQVSFWLCKGNVCRSTPRITWELNGYLPPP
jgi:hypothetical protein